MPSNVQTLYDLEVQVPYFGHGFENFMRDIKRTAALDEVISDGLLLYQTNVLTTTAVAIKTSAGKVYGVILKSNGTAGGIQLYNVAQGSVTVGTTANDLWIPVAATSGRITAVTLSGTSLADSWATAITGAATTGSRNNTAMANLPHVWVLYA